MEPLVIEVLGVPHHDRMADQLKIHFLKRRNNGGDVSTVIYPTSTPGQAYVVFESPEDVDSSFYPIHVKKAKFSEVDMPVETMLDLSMFSDQDSVVKLIDYYNFKVIPYSADHLQLKGSFLKLKLIRNELVQLQSRSHSKRSSILHKGSAWDPNFGSNSTSKNIDKMDWRPVPDSAPYLSSSYRDSTSDEPPRSLQSSYLPYTKRNVSSFVDAYRQSPLAEGASSLSGNSPSSPALVHHTSPLYKDSDLVKSPSSLHSSYYSSIGSTSHTVDTNIPNYLLTQQQQVTGNKMSAHRRSPLVEVVSLSSKNSTSSYILQGHTSYGLSASGGSPRSRPSVDADTSDSSSHSSPSSTSGRMETFPVDTDTINFILTQKQDAVKCIEKDFGTEMTLTDYTEYATVKFSGANCEKAKSYLLDTINKISPTLRTHEIDLKKFDNAEQKQILERIQHCKDSGVLITQSKDVLKIVGPSRESFAVKQKLLGQDNPHRGRTKERSPSSRSSSVPRHYRLQDHESDKRKSQDLVQGHEQTPRQDKNSQKKRNSEFQDKNKTFKEQSLNPDTELMSSQPKKSKTEQVMNKLKQLDLNPKKFKLKKK
ncbi:hypothetical protein C0J50_18763 [Silurus asotus]|uniref:RNA-binding protein 43 n=1 Tax=Silurus asotus TaxID=30991 RepID=A0AAD5ASL5_SILAS|nr:hypothetical protein C0J50_18763 [Silurus asotus]